MESDVLVKRAVASLMILASELEVVVSEAVDIPELVRDINKINPTVLLLNESLPLSDKDSLTHLLISHPKLKVVIVSVDSNWLHIFDKQDMLLTRLDDLLAIIRSG
jgi:DNA-binding NarL/FixJ family response regulator